MVTTKGFRCGVLTDAAGQKDSSALGCRPPWLSSLSVPWWYWKQVSSYPSASSMSCTVPERQAKENLFQITLAWKRVSAWNLSWKVLPAEDLGACRGHRGVRSSDWSCGDGGNYMVGEAAGFQPGPASLLHCSELWK